MSQTAPVKVVWKSSAPDNFLEWIARAIQKDDNFFQTDSRAVWTDDNFFEQIARAVQMDDNFCWTDSLSRSNGWHFFFERIAGAVGMDLRDTKSVWTADVWNTNGYPFNKL